MHADASRDSTRDYDRIAAEILAEAEAEWMIEPVFGDTKFNRRSDRFLRRGRAACRSEWRLINATGNLLKLHRHQIAAAAT